MKSRNRKYKREVRQDKANLRHQNWIRLTPTQQAAQIRANKLAYDNRS
jgi:hypothetical protein